MIELINKPVICVQLDKLSLDFMINHMFITCRDEPVIVFEGSKFYTVIEGRELADIMTEEEFLYYLYYECNKQWASEIEAAKEIFENNSKARLILADIPCFNMHNANFYRDNSYFSEEEYKNIYLEMYSRLKECGVNTFLVKIPQIEEITNCELHKGMVPLLDYKWFWNEKIAGGGGKTLSKKMYGYDI